jgi:hypothetical protein
MEVKAHMDPYLTLISGWLIVKQRYKENGERKERQRINKRIQTVTTQRPFHETVEGEMSIC